MRRTDESAVPLAEVEVPPEDQAQSVRVTGSHARKCRSCGKRDNIRVTWRGRTLEVRCRVCGTELHNQGGDR